MSKELKALKHIISEISNYTLHGIGDENWLGFQDVLNDVKLIEQALTPPTEQEVCKALSEFYNTENKTKIYNFKFEKGDFVSYGKMEMGGRYFLSIAEQPLSSIPTYLLKRIAMFYEGKVKE